jgi:DNA-binding winged helix-turn-helix (wHTH) protein
LGGLAVKFRIGDRTLDVDARQLTRGGEAIHLSPKAFELLRHLIEQRPRALSKQELHDHLWPDTFVSEANLASLINEIRQVLDDNAREPRFVRTVHRFGYAYCGSVMQVTERTTASDSLGFCWLVEGGRRLPLEQGENILGRDEEGIQIDSSTVSRRHACIRVSGSEAVIEDLGSKNGTFVRGERVAAPVPLNDGDEIRVGSVVSRFRMTLRKGTTTATWTEPESGS